jgi:hypothetical protein
VQKKRAIAQKKAPRAAKKAPKSAKKTPAGGADVPNLFRIDIEVGNLDEAADFYGKVFDIAGRKEASSRCSFTCGAVTLQVLDVSNSGTTHRRRRRSTSQ